MARLAAPSTEAISVGSASIKGSRATARRLGGNADPNGQRGLDDVAMNADGSRQCMDSIRRRGNLDRSAEMRGARRGGAVRSVKQLGGRRRGAGAHVSE
jgi:hypothetical protein